MNHVPKNKPARGWLHGTARLQSLVFRPACSPSRDGSHVEPVCSRRRCKQSVATLSELRGDGDGPLDHPCPLCGPERTAKLNQQRKVLRTWELTPGVITFYCVRCEAKGSAQANATQMLQRPRKLKPTRPPPDDKDKLSLYRTAVGTSGHAVASAGDQLFPLASHSAR